LKRFITLFIIFYFFAFELRLIAQTENIYAATQEFLELYNSGDIINAEKCLLQVIDSGYRIPKEYEFFIYTALGNTSSFLGRYKTALNYYNLAERSAFTTNDSSSDLGDIYINKAIIYGYQKSYEVAIDFFEKGIRIYQNSLKRSRDSYIDLSKAYMNLGIIYYEIKDYDIALDFFYKSLDIKEKMHISGLGLTYLNIAKTYVNTGNNQKAEEFFKKCIESFAMDYNSDYFRLAEVYIEYGLYLQKTGRHSETFDILENALSICRKNYGDKHSFVSLAYQYIGDHFLTLSKIDSALAYYQKSLISIVPGFNDPDIDHNPSIDSSLFDLRLLDNLKSKATALKLLSESKEDPVLKLKSLGKSLETIGLALGLITDIRNNYPTEESRLYLAENEKDTYASALHTANDIFMLTGSGTMKQKIYDIARQAKAAVLQDEITGNDILKNSGIPDSLTGKRNDLSNAISAYNNQISEESVKVSPDSAKVVLWKDALFEMNREKERVTELINSEFPQYNELFRKTEPLPFHELQKHLTRNEAIIDYFLCDASSENTRELFIFLVTRDKLEFVKKSVDSLFLSNIEVIRNAQRPGSPGGELIYSPGKHLNALFYMYQNLIAPVEEHIPGDNVIIIPDEEIAWIPFDALLYKVPLPGATGYEGQDYLIKKYAISYGYSSSLIPGRNPAAKRGEKLLSFAPDYGAAQSETGQPAELPGAGREIESIYRWFRGERYPGSLATETNFRNSMEGTTLLHLAMHSVSDTLNSKYSYLLFDERNDSLNDGRLYNYEISLGKINSQMVVLSACNSGTGTLYHGEGVMSLARSFILAGASSVIKTSWKVNDEVSADIITQFYYYLSKGKAKDEALRLAKLDFIESHPPSLSNPYYWAAYELLGDNAPVVNTSYKLLIPVIIALFGFGAVLFYFRRRRISPERSL